VVKRGAKPKPFSIFHFSIINWWTLLYLDCQGRMTMTNEKWKMAWACPPVFQGWLAANRSFKEEVMPWLQPEALPLPPQ
jgi:hypothetical protein